MASKVEASKALACVGSAVLGSGGLGLDCLVVPSTVEDRGAGVLTAGMVVPDEERVV